MNGYSEITNQNISYKISIINEVNSIDEEASKQNLKEKMSLISFEPSSFNRRSEVQSLIRTPSIVIDSDAIVSVFAAPSVAAAPVSATDSIQTN